MYEMFDMFLRRKSILNETQSMEQNLTDATVLYCSVEIYVELYFILKLKSTCSFVMDYSLPLIPIVSRVCQQTMQ